MKQCSLSTIKKDLRFSIVYFVIRSFQVDKRSIKVKALGPVQKLQFQEVLQTFRGSATFPAKRAKVVSLSEMRKKNGLRQTKREGLGIIRLDMATTEATAASDPSSWTSRTAFWRTSLTKSESTSAKPERHTAADFCLEHEHLSSRSLRHTEQVDSVQADGYFKRM